MIKRNVIIYCFVTAIIFILGMLFQKFGVPTMNNTVYLKTKEPMLLSTEGQFQYFHMLPAGTALYKFREFPEGHTTYIAYINIKGEFAQEEVESKYPVDPVWALPIQPDEVKMLTATTPISKDDLVMILKSRKMTRDDLAQIVRDWKD
jgi:hypothetical protein